MRWAVCIRIMLVGEVHKFTELRRFVYNFHDINFEYIITLYNSKHLLVKLCKNVFPALKNILNLRNIYIIQ